MTWHKFKGTLKKLKQKTERELLQDINSKLGSISGHFIVESFETRQSLEETHKLLIKVQNKTDQYLYITVMLFLISFGQQQPNEIPFFVSIFSDQIIWKLF